LTYIRGKIVKLRQSVEMLELDMDILKFLMPQAERLQELGRGGPDNLDEMSNIVTEQLSKRKSLLDITDEEVEMYLESLVTGDI
jgi:hypothetical protein